MNVLRAFFHTKPRSWAGCTPPSPADRMARYSLRHAEDMQRRANLGAGIPAARAVEGRLVLLALPGRVNQLPTKPVPIEEDPA